MPTDTSERGLENLIEQVMLERGWLKGNPQNYNREYAVDLVQLRAFIAATQPKALDALDLDNDSPTRRKFLARLQGQITKDGVIKVLRNGVQHNAISLELYYVTPTPGNHRAEELFAANRFSITRQLRYSLSETTRALDIGLFINGLPIITFELKNNLTTQNVADAVVQYKADRDPRELLFEFGRCVVHLAVDDLEVRMCSHLKGKGSWFLPFNKGWDDGAGNPPNPNGLKTAYLWESILLPASLSNIIENYAQRVEKEDQKTGKIKLEQVFPRYHQLDVVRRLLTHVSTNSIGHRYLIQHSAGSGKSNSITWLAYQLVGLQVNEKSVFDSVIVVTDRRNLDKQIKDNINRFAQVGSIVGHAENSGDLLKLIENGKKIIISTVQKFPYIIAAIGDEHRKRKFAIIIDEAHSSQGGRTSGAMSTALSDVGDDDDDETIEDIINRTMEAHKLLTNASYFAFTATPKNKTLEIFGEPFQDGDKVKRRPFHVYSMKQAIQEEFIMDVLRYYTPVNSYYKLIQKTESDPEFDSKKAQKKLRHYVESHDYAVSSKAEIMVDHFNEQVLAMNKIGGQARAMVVTSGIQQAILYYHAIKNYLTEIKSPYKAIVAFSGEHEYGGVKVTETSLNGFPSNQITDYIQKDPYRFLVAADKFQTGYDEPLLHTMYVDKPLSGIKAVQTLSRLNRAYPQKRDVFVLDFENSVDVIQQSFEDYYRTTILSEETDPNKLHDLKAELDAYRVYTQDQIDELVELYLKNERRDRLDPIIDTAVAIYKQDLNEDGQVNFKGKAKAFVRTYSFLSAILPFSNAEWEKLSIFLTFLIRKLPSPVEEDLSRGIIELIDMDSYRAEKQATMRVILADQNAEIGPIPTTAGGHKAEPELERLSNILKVFNDMFGNIPWSNADRVRQLISEEIPTQVSADTAYQNAKKNSDPQNARIEHDKALWRVMTRILNDDTELFKQFSDNDSFKHWLADTVFKLTYQPQGTGP